MIVLFVYSKKRDPKQLFQVLENGLVGGKVLKSFSVTQQIRCNSTNSSSLRVQFFFFLIQILRFIIQPIFLPGQVVD